MVDWHLSKEQIDELVVAQADNDTAWEELVQVKRQGPTSMALPPDLAARAAFFARLHQETSVEGWLARIIQERIDLEEAIFSGLKRQLASESS
ncbi:MAG: hypothetical protein JSV36_11370 [Anaerolineae bacterium]|nr:MAG: hypothetical protein JSV36_11370 [Anaerolineae bacterium]